METTPGFSISLSSSTEQFNGFASSRGDNTPRHPLYECHDSRCRSYTTCRQFQQFNTAALAEAGFYNIGVGNGTVIRCFFCAIELANPTYNDDPLLEHVKKSPNCGYLKQKLGEQRLKAYQEEGDDIHSTLQPINPMASLYNMRARLNLQDDEENAENVLENEAAKCVLDLGYSSEKVARTINELLAKGNVDYTSMDIMEIILEMEDRVDETDGDIHHSLTPRPSTRRNDLKQSLLEENRRLRKRMLCAVCKVTQKDICLLPCTHLCLCSNCADKTFICPICYKKIRDKIKTHII